jgi:hypothetical protein
VVNGFSKGHFFRPERGWALFPFPFAAPVAIMPKRQGSLLKCDFFFEGDVLFFYPMTLFTGLFFFSASANAYPQVEQARPSLHGSRKGITCPIKLVPNLSFGDIKLGMTLKELDALGMEIKQVLNSAGWYVVGLFSVRLEQGKVVLIEAELADLPGCVEFESKRIPKKAPLKDLRQIFKNCSQEENLIGGNVTRCDGITIVTGGWGGKQKSPSLRVSASLP